MATGVLTVLTPLLVEGGKAAARKAGEALRVALEKRFKGNPAAETALVDLKTGAAQIGGSVEGDVVMGSKTSPVFDQRGQQVQEQANVAGDLIKK